MQLSFDEENMVWDFLARLALVMRYCYGMDKPEYGDTVQKAIDVIKEAYGIK